MPPTISSRRPYRIRRSRHWPRVRHQAHPQKRLHHQIDGAHLNKVADEIDNRYLFEINSRWTIDGSPRRNVARYINHSCRPNAETDIVKGEILISAIRNIEPGEEITYDYGKDHFDGFIKPKGCKCVKCREKRRGARRSGRNGRK